MEVVPACRETAGSDPMVVLPAPLLQNETNARLNLQTPACVWSIYSNRFCIAKA
jgi:hypothetical protein